MFILSHGWNKILVHPEVHILVNEHIKLLKSKKKKKKVTAIQDLTVLIQHSQINSYNYSKLLLLFIWYIKQECELTFNTAQATKGSKSSNSKTWY